MKAYGKPRYRENAYSEVGEWLFNADGSRLALYGPILPKRNRLGKAKTRAWKKAARRLSAV